MTTTHDTIYQGVTSVAANCDGALSLDGVGFDGQDTHFGRRIAAIPQSAWTPEIWAEAARLFVKYQGQHGLPVTDEVRALAADGTVHAARNQARAAEKDTKAVASLSATQHGDRIDIRFSYSDRLVREVKGLPGRRWTGSSNEVDATQEAIDWLATNGADVSGLTATTEVRTVAVEARNPLRATVRRGDIVIRFPYDPELVSSVKTLPNRRFDGGDKVWTAPPSGEVAAWLAEKGFEVDAEAAQLLAEAAERDAERLAAEADAKARSVATEARGDVEVAIADDLYPFQRAGAEYIATRRQVIIADQMGLGKTRQAISGLLTSERFPALVVCPTSLRGNWARELAALTDLKVEILTGTKATVLPAADVYVIGYDVLKAWAPLLQAQVQALVVDESHYVKNPKALRTKALFEIREALAEDAPVVLLTGTPVLNRPSELISQLRLLGVDKFKAVTPRPRRGDSDRDYEFSFKFRYCGPENPNGYGWTFNGTSNADELNDRLRATCYVRRLKADVLTDLPQKAMPIQVGLSLNGKAKEYRKAVKALKAEIAERDDIGTAEAITLINGLRQLAGLAKVEPAVEWVQNWLDSNPGRKIVVFAAHIAVQHALVEAFDAPAILGGMGVDAVEEAKARFNDGDARVIVASLKAAREGHTLVANGLCSDVVFIEQGWTPGEHAQAEDRIHRIGQTGQVQAWYLLGEDVEIDWWLNALVTRKAINVTAVTEGLDVETQDATAKHLLALFAEEA